VQVRQLYEASRLGDTPVAVVLGSEGDGGIAEWQKLFAEQAALSTNYTMVTVQGAGHISLADWREDALQTSKVILRVVKDAIGE